MDPNLKDKQLAKLFQEYEKARSAPGASVELEIRIKEDIDKETFEELVRAAKASPDFGPPTLEMSVNIISMKVRGMKDTSQSIRKITYNGDEVVDTYLRKTRLVHPIILNGYLKHSVGLALEEPVTKFFSANDSIVRFKLRLSFVIKNIETIDGTKGVESAKDAESAVNANTEQPQWRLDITAIKMGVLQDLSTQLKQIRSEIFSKNITADNILEELNYEMLSGYEVEIEYIGGPKAPQDLRVVDKVFALVNRNYSEVIKYQDEIYYIAQAVQPESRRELFRKPTFRLKQLSNQVVSISKNTYYNDLYPPTGYYATEKADGQRTIISCHDGAVCMIFSDGMKTFPAPDDVKKVIVDAEYITYDVEGGKTDGGKTDGGKTEGGKTEGKAKDNVSTAKKLPSIYIFDCMVCGDNIADQGFELRLVQLEEAAEILRKLIPEHNVYVKRYVKLGRTPAELEVELTSVYSPETAPYNVDGVIITEPGRPYYQTANYKWKPYENNTIDFLAVKCPRELLGIRPYDNKQAQGLKLYILFVGIDHNQREKLGIGLIAHYKSMFPESAGATYYPIQFSPSAYPLAYLYYHKADDDIDRKIVELSRNRDNTEWIFHRVRTDRTLERNYFGNDYRIAELTFSNYIDPFEFSALWTPSTSYFTKTADDMYVASNKFKRFVISLLLKENISGSKWVIDAAAGRGADLHRYQEIGVENALFIDVDETAITELIRRKYSFMQAKKRHVRSWIGSDDAQMKVVTHRNAVTDIEYDKLLVKEGKSLTVHTLVADLKSPAEEMIAKTAPFGINTASVDGIVCNFAIHYLCDTAGHIANFLQFVSKMLKTGGIFIFTTMDGGKVFNELSTVQQGGTWEVTESDVIKYALRRDYDGKKFAQTGQMIAVKLPFSNEMYQEPLCNIEYVISVAKKYSLELEQYSPMDTYMERFKKADRGLYDRLTDGDRKYIALHSFVTLRKVK